jgi:integrase
MPKKAKEMGARAVAEKAKVLGLHAVGGVPGLQLQVRGDAVSWILRVMIGGKRRDIGLGGYPAVLVAAARDKARVFRAKIDQGIDPIAERHIARAALVSALTFDEAAKRLIASKAPGFKNAKHLAQWQSTLDTYASPFIGQLPIDKIDIHHIESVLSPIWTEKTETAKRVQGRIEAVLAWATVSKHRSGDNPARWKHNLDKLFPAPNKVTKKQKQPALPLSDMPRFMVALRKRAGAARALEFAILTATRSNEVRGATWDEIDLVAKLWTIPAERMKADREHVVPLSPQAVRLLKGLSRLAGTNLIFPAPRGGQLSDATLAKVVKLMHEADTKSKGPGFMDPKQKRVAVAHGFRSTFRDWTAERTNYPNEVAEMALAHTIGNKVEASYRRGDLVTKRTKMMADWADFIETMPHKGNVTSIRRKAK